MEGRVLHAPAPVETLSDTGMIGGDVHPVQLTAAGRRSGHATRDFLQAQTATAAGERTPESMSEPRKTIMYARENRKLRQ